MSSEKLESFRKFMLWNFFLLFFYEAALEISMSLVIGYKYTSDHFEDHENPKYNTNNTRN